MRWLLSLALLLWASSAEAITIVQKANNWLNGVTAVSATFSANPIAGNAIILGMIQKSTDGSTPVPGTITVTDSAGNTWTQAIQTKNDTPGFAQYAYIWYARNIINATTTVTVHSTANNHLYFEIVEVNGLDVGPGVLDQINGAAFGGTVYNSGNVITTQTDELLVGLVDTNGAVTVTPAAGWTSQDVVISRVYFLTQIVSATGTYSNSGTLNTSDQGVAQIATFKASTSTSALQLKTSSSTFFSIAPGGALQIQ